MLARLFEAIAREADPVRLLRLVAETIGTHLGVTRVAYGEVEPGTDWITVPIDWTSAVPSMVGRHRLYRQSTFVRRYEQGEVVAAGDVGELKLEGEERRLLERTFCRSCISVPLRDGGELVALFSVTHREPRAWTEEEVALVEQTGARVWSALRQVRAAARLRESEEQFRTLAESLPAICWIADRGGRAIWVNSRGDRSFAGALRTGADIAAVVHPEDLEGARRCWRAARGPKSDGSFELTIRMRDAGGGYRPFLTRAQPVLDPDGRVLRWCVTHVDLTEKHSRDRHDTFFRRLSDAIREETDASRILLISADALRKHLGISFVVYNEADAAAGMFVNHHGSVDDEGPWNDGPIAVPSEFEPLLAALGRGETVVSRDLHELTPILTEHVRDFFAGWNVRSGISVPLVKDGRLVVILSAQHDEPREWSADEVTLVEELAERTWAAYTRARAETALQERERHQSFLLGWSDALRSETDPDAIAAETLARLGAHLGTARANLAEMDATGTGFSVLQEWRRDGGNREAQRAGLSDGVHQGYLSGAVVICSDIANDRRFGIAARDRYLEVEAAAFIGVPLVRGGRVVAVLSVQQGTPRNWTATETQLVRDVAERAWIMLERARAEAALAERERAQAFLIDWNDAVRAEGSPRAILAMTLDRLGDHLGVSRCNYAEVVRPGSLSVLQEWNQGVVSLTGAEFPFEALGRDVVSDHLSGRSFVSADVLADPRFGPETHATYRAAEVRGVVSMPLVRDGALVAILSVQQSTPRGWTEAETRLVCEIADRTWATLERARFGERLAESEALLAAFMENAPLGMHLTDASGSFLRVNPELSRQLDVPIGDLVGRRPYEFLSSDSGRRVAELHREALSGRMTSAEFEFPGRETYTALQAVVFPIIGTDGAVKTGGFTIDMTERKRAEAALDRSREALFQTEKLSALGSLLAGVSHELNNPLSIVVAQTVMMERQAKDTEIAERAQKVRRAADRCARIVQTFLAMARQKRPEREPVDLNQVVTAALDLAEYGLRTEGVAVTRALTPDLHRIAADADQLHQIVVNLLINAQQAIVEAGSTERRVTIATAPGPEPGTVILDIADTGPGVPEAARRRIFEPFFTTKPQGQGTGVGLSFSQGLAEAHGGRLALIPSARGATFRLTLPIDETLTLPRAAPDGPAPTALPVRRALVVDDEEEIAEALADFLTVEGFGCDIAVGGAAAKARLVEGSYDLIVSDLRMPEVDGPALHAWLLEARPDLARRIAFTTGDTLGVGAARFLASADRPVLEKPFMPVAVRRLLEQMELA